MTPASEPRTHIPQPADIYEDYPVDVTRPLSPFQEELILSACPPGSRIVEARFAREDRLPCPVRVHVASPGGEEQQLILRMDQHIDGVAIDAALLPVLARLALPVPTVLAGPSYDPAGPSLGALSVLSVLPGQDLLSWAWDGAAAADLVTATRLVLDSVERLHHLTESLSRDPVAFTAWQVLRRVARPDLRYQVVFIDFLISPEEAAELGTDLEVRIGGNLVQVAPAIRSYVLRITNFGGARIEHYDDPIVIDFGTQATKVWTVTKPESFPGNFTVPKPILNPTSVEVGKIALNSRDGIRVRCLVESEERIKPVVRARGDGFSIVREITTNVPFNLRETLLVPLLISGVSVVAFFVTSSKVRHLYKTSDYLIMFVGIFVFLHFVFCS